MITQHHEPVDFDKFYETMRSRYIGIDYRDYETFMRTEGEKHSFIGVADGTNRMRDALANAVSNDKEIVGKATSLMVTVLLAPEMERPIGIQEVKGMIDFVSDTLPDIQFVWGFADGASLGDKVKVIALVNIGE